MPSHPASRPPSGRPPAHPATHPVERRARVAALRSQRRRPLREDGPQRHRVRADGRLRRGAQRARQGEHRRRGPRRGRRDGAAPPSAVLPLRLRPRRHHRGVAPGQRGRQLAARPHCRGARRRPQARGVRRERLGLRRGTLDRQRGDRRRRARPGAVGVAVPAVQLAVAAPTSPTRCSRRCAPASAGTSSDRRATR